MSRSDPHRALAGEMGSRIPARGPSPAEVAAIVAAVELVWPRGGGVSEPTPPDRSWRFSGRWWLPDRSAAMSWPGP